MYIDRFKFRAPLAEPRTPVRLPNTHFQQSSSSDDYELGSSPSTMLQARQKQYHKSPVMQDPRPPSSYMSSQRENPLRALALSKSHPVSALNPIDEFYDSEPASISQRMSSESPHQSIGLSHAPLMAQGIPLVPVEQLPEKYRNIFPYKVLNATQSKCFHSVFNTNDNLVLSAPTGAGKTVVMELAVCRLMETFEPGTFKIVYQAPTKALCSERKRDWEKKFALIGLKCTELTGDTEFHQLAEVKSGDVIVTTPEKWDSVTRRWTDHKKLLNLVRLFLVSLDNFFIL